MTARITAVATQRSCFLSLPGHPVVNPKFPRSQSNVLELTINLAQVVIDHAGIAGGRGGPPAGLEGGRRPRRRRHPMVI